MSVNERRDFTLVLPYYLNAGMLKEQLRLWSEFPEDLKPHFHAIVVDDCSPREPAREAIPDDVVAATGIASFQLYRTLVDVRWNWLFCRNLGVEKATTGWVLLTDIDHGLPHDTLRYLIEHDLSKHNVYKFQRVDAPRMSPYKPHPNSWFMTKKMYEEIGGYDERFSGFYGTDADFRERVLTTARSLVLTDKPLIRYPREHIADASTTTYGRKEPQDRVNVPRIRAERARIPNWRPLRLTFEWERLV